MCPDALYFITLYSLTTDDFPCQRESAATEWDNNTHINILEDVLLGVVVDSDVEARILHIKPHIRYMETTL
jgi:hypothetical protein